MITLVLATAGVLGLTLIAALVVVLIFSIQTGTFIADAAAALEVAAERGSRLTERFERIHRVTQTAASEIAQERP